MCSISVIVPVYRSANTIVELHERIAAAMVQAGKSYEIIFVEDDGGDGSWDEIVALSRKDACSRGVRLCRNFGQHNALLCGIRLSTGSAIVTLDDDLQNPPEEIPKLLAKLDEGTDVVYGTPEQEQHGFLRDMASRFTKWAIKSGMGANTASDVSAFRALRGSLRDALRTYNGPYVSIDVLLTWGTTRFASVTVKHSARSVGTSNYTLRKLARHAINMITGFSVMPLRLASYLGLLFTFFGVAVLVYVLARYFVEHASPPGFAFLACIIAVFSGAQLFALGIMGEYLARMHFRLMDRPCYLVRETTERTG